jgi:hypothetical protein
VVVEVISAHHVHFAGGHSRLHSSVVPPAIEMQSNVICMERCIVVVSTLGENLASHIQSTAHDVVSGGGDISTAVSAGLYPAKAHVNGIYRRLLWTVSPGN